ncbi:MAG: metallophosphoesterase [Anaerolineaceae bacterium]|nr:metallophosphoesterase [Anaerolineaceae bacterium]
MSANEVFLRFVQISDTHISHDENYNRPPAPHTPLAGTHALLHALRQLPFPPDFIIHTGDVVYDPHPEAYVKARSLLTDLPAPLYYLAGNHDDPHMLQEILLGIPEPRLPYDQEFESCGVQILCLDSGRLGGDEAPAGRLTEAQLAWLRRKTYRKDPRPLLVFIHHNPLPQADSPWLESMRLQNGEDFHAALLPARERLRGVFYGHIHQAMQLQRDGILYCSAVSSWQTFRSDPGESEMQFEMAARPGFNVVSLSAGLTAIRRHSFAVEPNR